MLQCHSANGDFVPKQFHHFYNVKYPNYPEIWQCWGKPKMTKDYSIVGKTVETSYNIKYVDQQTFETNPNCMHI